MKYRSLLWVNALVFCVYLAGHLFDICFIVPNWKSGDLEDIKLYNTFFHKADPRQFFSTIRPISIFTSFLCLVVFWSKSSILRALLIISFLIDVLIYIVTLYFFTPINEYLFLQETVVLEPALVKQYVSKWVAFNYIRIALITVGFYTSIWVVHFSYKTR